MENQTFDDYEIIAVDDCSTDGSLAILRDYGKRYPDRFRAVHSEKNLHQGGAKNIGIRMVYAIARKIDYQNILGLNVLTIHI